MRSRPCVEHWVAVSALQGRQPRSEDLERVMHVQNVLGFVCPFAFPVDKNLLGHEADGVGDLKGYPQTAGTEIERPRVVQKDLDERQALGRNSSDLRSCFASLGAVEFAAYRPNDSGWQEDGSRRRILRGNRDRGGASECPDLPWKGAPEGLCPCLTMRGSHGSSAINRRANGSDSRAPLICVSERARSKPGAVFRGPARGHGRDAWRRPATPAICLTQGCL